MGDLLFELTDDVDTIPLVSDPICSYGDVWQLGNHRIICGDSTNKTDVDKLMDGNKCDLVFTDPPYNIDNKGGKTTTLKHWVNKKMAAIDFISKFTPVGFLSLLSSLFDTDTMNAYIFCNKSLVVEYLKYAQDNKFHSNILFWLKRNSPPINKSHRSDLEYLIFIRKNSIWNYGIKGVSYSKCLEWERVREDLHETMKPIRLIINEILISSNENSIVFDGFLGSGSTLIACEKAKRKCYGIEIEPYYCDVVINRWQKMTNKKAIKIGV